MIRYLRPVLALAVALLAGCSAPQSYTVDAHPTANVPSDPQGTVRQEFVFEVPGDHVLFVWLEDPTGNWEPGVTVAETTTASHPTVVARHVVQFVDEPHPDNALLRRVRLVSLLDDETSYPSCDVNLVARPNLSALEAIGARSALCGEPLVLAKLESNGVRLVACAWD